MTSPISALGSNPFLTKAFISGEQTREAEKEEEKRKKKERESQKFNLINAIIDAGTAWVVSGGNPLAAGVGALSSQRGKTDVGGAGIHGFAQGSIMKNIFDPATAASPPQASPISALGETAGNTIGSMTNPQNMGQTAAYLSAVSATDPSTAIQSVAASAKISGERREELYKKFQSSYKVIEPFVKQYIEAGDVQGAGKILSKFKQDNPDLKHIMPDISGLPAYKGGATKIDEVLQTFNIQTPEGVTGIKQYKSGKQETMPGTIVQKENIGEQTSADKLQKEYRGTQIDALSNVYSAQMSALNKQLEYATGKEAVAITSAIDAATGAYLGQIQTIYSNIFKPKAEMSDEQKTNSLTALISQVSKIPDKNNAIREIEKERAGLEAEGINVDVVIEMIKDQFDLLSTISSLGGQVTNVSLQGKAGLSVTGPAKQPKENIIINPR